MSLNFNFSKNNETINQILYLISDQPRKLVSGLTSPTLTFDIQIDEDVFVPNNPNSYDLPDDLISPEDFDGPAHSGKWVQKRTRQTIQVIDGDKNKIYIQETDKPTTRKNITIDELYSEIESAKHIQNSGNQRHTAYFINQKTTFDTSEVSKITAQNIRMNDLKSIYKVHLDTENIYQLFPQKDPKAGLNSTETIGELFNRTLKGEALKEHQEKVKTNNAYREFIKQIPDEETMSKFRDVPVQITSVEYDPTGGQVLSNSIYHDGNKATLMTHGKKPTHRMQPILDSSGKEIESTPQLGFHSQGIRNLQNAQQKNIVENLFNLVQEGNTIDEALSIFTENANTEVAKQMEHMLNPILKDNKLLVAFNVEFDKKALSQLSPELQNILKKVNTADSREFATEAKQAMGLPTLIHTQADNSAINLFKAESKRLAEIYNPFNSDGKFTNEFKHEVKFSLYGEILNELGEDLTSKDRKKHENTAKKDVDLFFEDKDKLPQERQELIQEQIDKVKNQWKKNVDILSRDADDPVQQQKMLNRIHRTTDGATNTTLREVAALEYFSVLEDQSALTDGGGKANQQKLASLKNALAGNAHEALTDTIVDAVMASNIENTSFSNMNSDSLAKGIVLANLTDVKDPNFVGSVSAQTKFIKDVKVNKVKKDLLNFDNSAAAPKGLITSASNFLAGSIAVAATKMAMAATTEEQNSENEDKIKQIIMSKKIDGLINPGNQSINPAWAAGAGIGLLAYMHNMDNKTSIEFNKSVMPFFRRAVQFIDDVKTPSKGAINATASLFKEAASNVKSKAFSSIKTFSDGLKEGLESYSKNFDDNVSLKAIGIGAIAAVAMVGLANFGRSQGKLEYEAKDEEYTNEAHELLTGNAYKPESRQATMTEVQRPDLLKNLPLSDIPLTRAANINSVSEIYKHQSNIQKVNERRQEEEQEYAENTSNTQQFFSDSFQKRRNQFDIIDRDLKKTQMKSGVLVR